MLHQLTAYIFWSVLTAQNKKLHIFASPWWLVNRPQCGRIDLYAKRLTDETTSFQRSKFILFAESLVHTYGEQTLNDLTSRWSREHVAAFTTYFHCLVSIHYNRSRSIHSRRSEDTKRNKQRYQNENDYYALLVEKTRHERNQPV